DEAREVGADPVGGRDPPVDLTVEVPDGWVIVLVADEIACDVFDFAVDCHRSTSGVAALSSVSSTSLPQMPGRWLLKVRCLVQALTALHIRKSGMRRQRRSLASLDG